MSEPLAAPYRMQVRYRSPFPLGVLEWNAPSPVVTIVVSASFQMMGDGAALVADRQEALGADQPFVGVHGELYRANDFLPAKGAVDVLVVGHAHSAHATTTIPIALSIGRRRVSWVAVSPRPAHAIPLLSTHLLSSSHPSAGAVRLAPAPAGPRDWRRHVRGGKFDFSTFNAAPPEHRLAELELGAPMVLEGLVEGEPLRFVEVPTRMPFVFLAHRTSAGLEDEIERVPMVCDTLWIDVDRCALTMTWRGTTARPKAFGPEPTLILLDGQAGRPPPMSDVLASITGASSYLAATEDTAAYRPAVRLDPDARRAAFPAPAAAAKTEVLEVGDLASEDDDDALATSQRTTVVREGMGTMPPPAMAPPPGAPIGAALPAADAPPARTMATATTGRVTLSRPTLVLLDETDDEDATLHEHARPARAGGIGAPEPPPSGPNEPPSDEAQEPAPITPRVGLQLGSQGGFALGGSTLSPTGSVAPLPFAARGEPRVGASAIHTPDQRIAIADPPTLAFEESESPAREPRALPLEPIAMPPRPPGGPELPGASRSFHERTRTESVVPLAEPLPFARAPTVARSGHRTPREPPNALSRPANGEGAQSTALRPHQGPCPGPSQRMTPPPPRPAPSARRRDRPAESGRGAHDAPLVPELPLATYATVKAELAACGADAAADAVLKRHALDPESWLAIERRQARAIARDAAEARGELGARVRAAVASARRSLTIAAEPVVGPDLERYANLQVALQHADRAASEQLLQDAGLEPDAWERMQRMWAHRARTDRRTAAKLRQAMARAERERQGA